MAYDGPSVMTEVAKVRETPYLTSSQVIGEPSWNETPSRSVKLQSLPPFAGVPRSVARSGVRPVPLVGSGS